MATTATTITFKTSLCRVDDDDNEDDDDGDCSWVCCPLILESNLDKSSGMSPRFSAAQNIIVWVLEIRKMKHKSSKENERGKQENITPQMAENFTDKHTKQLLVEYNFTEGSN